MLDQGKVVLLIVQWAIVSHFQLFPLRLRSAQLGVAPPEQDTKQSILPNKFFACCVKLCYYFFFQVSVEFSWERVAHVVHAPQVAPNNPSLYRKVLLYQ